MTKRHAKYNWLIDSGDIANIQPESSAYIARFLKTDEDKIEAIQKAVRFKDGFYLEKILLAISIAAENDPEYTWINDVFNQQENP